MRQLVRNVLSSAEAQDLVGYQEMPDSDAREHPVAMRLVKQVCELTGGQLTDFPRSVRVECIRGLPNPHSDNGLQYTETVCRGERVWEVAESHMGAYPQMSWVRYAASCLLTDPRLFEGGTFYYGNPYRAVMCEDHHLGLAIHDSEEIHGVEKCEGDRFVFLIFLG